MAVTAGLWGRRAKVEGGSDCWPCGGTGRERERESRVAVTAGLWGHRA